MTKLTFYFFFNSSLNPDYAQFTIDQYPQDLPQNIPIFVHFGSSTKSVTVTGNQLID